MIDSDDNYVDLIKSKDYCHYYFHFKFIHSGHLCFYLRLCFYLIKSFQVMLQSQVLPVAHYSYVRPHLFPQLCAPDWSCSLITSSPSALFHLPQLAFAVAVK